MGTDLASMHSGDAAKGLEPPFPQVLALDRLNQADKKRKRDKSPCLAALPAASSGVWGKPPVPARHAFQAGSLYSSLLLGLC